MDDYVDKTFRIDNGNDKPIRAKVLYRVKDKGGAPVGEYNPNPFLDTRTYAVEMPDGKLEEYTANIIAENLYSQIDAEGRELLLFKEITDHRAINPIKKGDYNAHWRSTRGWELLVEWHDGSMDWMPLADLKASNPLQVAEYAKANKIDDEPAFKWWVPYVLKKKNRIINKVKGKYWKTSHKFGIRLPHSVEEALRIDQENGNHFWEEAIKKEMKKIMSMQVFEKMEGMTVEDLRSGRKKLPGFKEIGIHMVFDIKMDGKFTRKARLVANGHETRGLPKHDTYSSVVSRDTVRLGFMYASLNKLKILSCDVSNAYLYAKCKEKLWTKAGKEFGIDEGSPMRISRALYGLQTAGQSWGLTLAKTLMDMGYRASKGDPNVYQKKRIRETGEAYYEWIIVFLQLVHCLLRVM